MGTNLLQAIVIFGAVVLCHAVAGADNSAASKVIALTDDTFEHLTQAATGAAGSSSWDA